MSNKEDPNDPSNVSLAYSQMINDWIKIDTLLTGTDAMREAGQRFLPQHAAESDEGYRERGQKAT